MPIDYLVQSEKYRPEVIKTLLIGEAPPPTGKSYFYFPAPIRRTESIRNNISLPATIFQHYFGRLPQDDTEYGELLLTLKAQGVFLIDIYDEPIKVRGSSEGIKTIVAAIPTLRKKIKRRNIEIADEKIFFLLARNDYRKYIRHEFPISRLIPWIDFRMQNVA